MVSRILLDLKRTPKIPFNCETMMMKDVAVWNPDVTGIDMKSTKNPVKQENVQCIQSTIRALTTLCFKFYQQLRFSGQSPCYSPLCTAEQDGLCNQVDLFTLFHPTVDVSSKREQRRHSRRNSSSTFCHLFAQGSSISGYCHFCLMIYISQ